MSIAAIDVDFQSNGATLVCVYLFTFIFQLTKKMHLSAAGSDVCSESKQMMFECGN